MKNLINRVCAQKTENSTLTMTMALLWAAAIIIGAWLTRGSENAEAIYLILLIGSSSTILFGNRSQKNQDC